MPDDRVLNLKVVLLDFASRKDIRYAYKIEGFQDQWVYTKNNVISIIKPSFGKHILKLKARGSSGEWSNEVLSLPMFVIKPFYLQNWFLIPSTMLFFGLIYAYFQRRLSREKKQRAMLEMEVKKRTHQIEKDKAIILAQADSLKELDKAKTRFFLQYHT